MKSKIVIVLVLILLVAQNGYSQPFFYSQSLQKLYNSLPEACRLSTSSADTVILCSGIVTGVTVPVAFCWDEYGILEHIGYRFFNNDEVMQNLNTPVIRFLEREMLALLATDNLDHKLSMNQHNGMMIALNGNTPQRSFYRSRTGLSYLLQQISGINITHGEGRYRVDIQCGLKNALNFQFVADAELLSDMDKKERDGRIAVQLSQHKSKSDAVLPHLPSCSDTGMEAINDSTFVCKGRAYIIPQINNNLYYTKVEGDFKLVFDINRIIETLSNVLIAPTERNYTLQITQRMYGGEQSRYELDSRDFFDYFSGDYERYFGLETAENDILTGTLILSDRNSRSIHLAYVSVTVADLLFNGTMQITLNANIPLHNVETIFGSNKNEQVKNQ